MGTKKDKGPPKIVRSIGFYYLDCGYTPDKKPIDFDAKGTLKTLATLKGDARFLQRGGSNPLLALPESPFDGYERMRLATIRRNDLPMKEVDGILEALDLKVDEGLAEVVNYVFFPNNIVGCDFNFYAARPTALAEYLTARGGDAFKTSYLAPLLREDAAKKLRETEGLVLAEMKMRASYIKAMDGANNSFLDALKSIVNLGDTDTIQLVLKKKEGILDTNVTTLIRDIRKKKDLEDNVSTLKVKLSDGEPLDLLSDRFLLEQQILKVEKRSRAVDPMDAARAIRDVYKANEQALLKSSAAARTIK